MTTTIAQQQQAIAELATLVAKLAREVNFPSDGTTIAAIINRAQKVKAEMTTA